MLTFLKNPVDMKLMVEAGVLETVCVLLALPLEWSGVLAGEGGARSRKPNERLEGRGENQR